jgi:hypothetical protein
MSKIALSGNASGTGTFTIASPNSNTDRTLNLPDAGGTVFVSGQALSATTGSFSGDVTLGSSVLATPTGSAPSYTCRAWVNFNGTGTVAIRASGNVSSITDNGTGDYAVNFTTAMPDADYSAVGTCRGISGVNSAFVTFDDTTNFSTTSARIDIRSPTDNTPRDTDVICIAIFR